MILYFSLIVGASSAARAKYNRSPARNRNIDEFQYERSASPRELLFQVSFHFVNKKRMWCIFFSRMGGMVDILEGGPSKLDGTTVRIILFREPESI